MGAAPDPGLEALVEQAMADPAGPRVAPLDTPSGRFWLKRVKSRGLALRLAKGKAADLAAHEVAAMRGLGAAGFRVPVVVYFRLGQYFVTRDIGTPLNELLQEESELGRAALLTEAGAALAALHAGGSAHGGAHLRNLCRATDGAVGFIDLEKAHAGDAGLDDMAYDLRVAVFSVLALYPGREDLAQALINGYGAGPVLMAARAWCRSHQWLATLAAPLRWHEARFRPDREYRQYSALPQALRLLAGQGDARPQPL
jgi:tRNA A-37 threonylcarbamoyl transferase component Bud32